MTDMTDDNQPTFNQVLERYSALLRAEEEAKTAAAEAEAEAVAQAEREKHEEELNRAAAVLYQTLYTVHSTPELEYEADVNDALTRMNRATAVLRGEELVSVPVSAPANTTDTIDLSKLNDTVRTIIQMVVTEPHRFVLEYDGRVVRDKSFTRARKDHEASKNSGSAGPAPSDTGASVTPVTPATAKIKKVRKSVAPTETPKDPAPVAEPTDSKEENKDPEPAPKPDSVAKATHVEPKQSPEPKAESTPVVEPDPTPEPAAEPEPEPEYPNDPVVVARTAYDNDEGPTLASLAASAESERTSRVMPPMPDADASDEDDSKKKSTSMVAKAAGWLLESPSHNPR